MNLESPPTCTVTCFAFQNEMDHLRVNMVLRYAYSTIRNLKISLSSASERGRLMPPKTAEQALRWRTPLERKQNRRACASKTVIFFLWGLPATGTAANLSLLLWGQHEKGLELLKVNLILLFPSSSLWTVVTNSPGRTGSCQLRWPWGLQTIGCKWLQTFPKA